MNNYITMEVWAGLWTLIRLIPSAFIIWVGVIIFEVFLGFATKKRLEFKILKSVCWYLWILIILSILKITGILGGNFGISSPLDSYISFGIFEDGFNAATILNICLFIPYGLLPVFIFNNINKHWWNGIFMGGVFSFIIEFLQTFIGRFAQVDDIIMNTLGTHVGFLIGIWILHIQNKNS